MSLYLLQVRVNYFSSFGDSNPIGTIIVLSVIGGAIVVSLIVGFIKNGVSAASMGRIGGSEVAPRRFSGLSLRRLGTSYGLTREQVKLLEFVFRNDGVSDPERVMANSTLLDRHFKRAYRTIEESSGNDEEIQQRLSQLFTLRNVIEAVSPEGEIGKITEDMTGVLFTGRDSFPVKVLSTKGEGILVENPQNALGTALRIPKGSRVTLSFFTKASTGFSYECRVLDTPDLPRGPALQVIALGKAKPLAQRKFKRKATSINCSFFFVFEEEGTRGSRQPQLVVDRRKFTGTIIDISVGGCSMKSSAAIKAGSRLKLEINTDEAHSVVCLGEVLRINRSGTIGTVIHIRFLKVPRKTFNTINSLVFGYAS